MGTVDEILMEYLCLVHRMVDMTLEEFDEFERAVKQTADVNLHGFIAKIRIEREG